MHKKTYKVTVVLKKDLTVLVVVVVVVYGGLELP